MSQAVSDFYGNNKQIYNEIQVLDGTVDFGENTEFISKSGIKKDVQTDAIEIILDLVRMGKIDPWNIDIVDLYDKYMARISELKQDNLRSVGKALLFSSTLLKIKSDIFQGISINDFEVEPLDYFEDDDFGDDFEQMQIPTNNIVSFDEVLQRRTSVRLNRKRNVTLKDLIRHIQFYEELEKKYAIKSALDRKERRVRNYASLKAHQIKELAHDEYVEEVVERMRQNLAQILEREENIELRELCLLNFDRSSAYIALLFLTREEKYELYQEEFYGKLFVRKTQETENNDENVGDEN
ncbi:MAG: segregation/condensation protein A [Candidatus Gastranaerophilales bacterium]|nr:segregation/condensation protein A [Candidatus Gastranaerophilales bacterium]